MSSAGPSGAATTLTARTTRSRGSTGRRSTLRRDHPVLRRRRFLTGAEAHEIRWFTPSGSEMTDADWADPGARCVTVYLDGVDAPDRDADGNDLLDDDLLLVVNGWWEPLDITVPTARPGATWQMVLDSATPAVTAASPGPPLTAGDTFTALGRSISVLTSDSARR